MEFYKHSITVYRNGKEISNRDGGFVLLDGAPENHKDTLTWDNLLEYYHNYGIVLPFNIWNFRKGHLISFFDYSLFKKDTWDIKEWKSNLNLEIEHRYEEYTPPSINFVLNWPNMNKAIQYLKEHGLELYTRSKI